MSPTPDISEQINLVFTIASLGLFGAFLSVTYVVERSGVELLRWLLYLLVAAVLAGAGLAGLALAASDQVLDDPALGEALGAVEGSAVTEGEGADGSVVEDETESGETAPPAAPAADSAAAAADLSAMAPAFSAIGRWLAALALVGLLLLLRPVRRLLARLVPIDPDRPVHMVALQYALLLVLVSAATGIFIDRVIQNPEAFPLEDLGEAANLSSLWAQAAGFVIIAFLGVGLGVARGGRETMERLGLTRRFSLRWWLGVTLAGLLAGFGVDQLWQFVSPETLESVETITDALFGDLIQTGLPGALTIGLSAGIGEELLFRGALQPRFGIVLTSLLFAAIHTQYSVSPALLQIFVIGMLLGLARQRAGTWTAIGAHASYNFVLALISMCDEGVLSCPW